MDVNRDNFYDILPEILNDINNADYVAVDGEFTGILRFNNMSRFDTPAERYKRHYEYDRHYLMIQIGLAMIQCTNQRENRYALKAYNFYLFSENETDAFEFRSKSSSLQFLAANHFDFAQLFLKGIPFVCKTKYLETLKSSQLSSSNDNNPQISNGITINKKRKPEATTNSVQEQLESSNASNAESLKNPMIGFSEVMWKLQESNIISNTGLNVLYKRIRESPFPSCRFDVVDNFKYASNGHEHTAGYDATCTAICMTEMMAYIAEKTEFKGNPIEHALVNTFNGKLFIMLSFDLTYVDLLNDDDLPDRSCIFYVSHPQTWSTANVREYFSQWNLLAYDQLDLTTHIIAVSLEKDTIQTILSKMRANDKNLIITPYAEYHHLDTSKIKTKELDPLFDLNPNNRRSNNWVCIDNDTVSMNIPSYSTEKSIQTMNSYNHISSGNKTSSTIN
ncbi:unnamed protein product [Rotaria sp. Silwood1]|nr:unnamed protein product [Rotaria sp. Silwood1]